jgi:hypothetical protein
MFATRSLFAVCIYADCTDHALAKHHPLAPRFKAGRETLLSQGDPQQAKPSTTNQQNSQASRFRQRAAALSPVAAGSGDDLLCLTGRNLRRTHKRRGMRG